MLKESSLKSLSFCDARYLALNVKDPVGVQAVIVTVIGGDV